MSLLYGEILTDTYIDTEIRIDKNINIKSVRAHILKYGNLSAGELELSIYQGVELLNSAEISYTQINDITNDEYLHGWVRFDIPTSMNWDFDTDYAEYTLRIRYNNYGLNDKLYLISDLNPPNVELHDTTSIYVRGFEIFVSRQF